MCTYICLPSPSRWHSRTHSFPPCPSPARPPLPPSLAEADPNTETEISHYLKEVVQGVSVKTLVWSVGGLFMVLLPLWMFVSSYQVTDVVDVVRWNFDARVMRGGACAIVILL